MHAQDFTQLELAVTLLENPNIAMKIADLIGTPIEKAIALLPNRAVSVIGKTTNKVIHGALTVAIKTMDTSNANNQNEAIQASNGWHKAAAATTGAVGGFFGAAALAIELPISTTIMMRSIADVARSEGANLQDIQTQLECIQVLAFGGQSSQDDGAEIGYFLAREALAKAMADAAAHIAAKGLEKEAAPAIVKLIVQISERYAISVTEKMAAQLVPVLGAVGGALVNTLFIDHFQDMARGHFILRRLEKVYGSENIQQKYKAIVQASKVKKEKIG